MTVWRTNKPKGRIVKIVIDTTVEFYLKGRDLTVSVDAEEYDDFIRTLKENKRTPRLKDDGTPAIDDKGNPVTVLLWATVDAELAKWFKEHARIDLKHSEIRGIWKMTDREQDGFWAKKNAIWDGQEPEQLELQTLQSFTESTLSG